MNQQRPSNENFTQFRNGPSTFSGMGGGAIGSNMIRTTSEATIPGQQHSHVPPPLPPRNRRSIPTYQPRSLGYNNMGIYNLGNNWNYRGLGAGGGGYSSYGGYGGYSHLHPFGMQTSGYSNQLSGPSGDAEERFVQFAEESSRRTFQSIESVVQTFSSVAMMMESTLFAMTSSFRAILSVAEHVGRMRSMFGELLSTFALVRLLKWLYRKITYMLGLNPDDPSTERVWRKMAVEAINGDGTTAGSSRSWPIIIFLGLIVAIPFLINKLVNNVRQTKLHGDDPREWFRRNEPVYSALVLYDFEAATAEELSVKSGQKVWIAPKSLQQKDIPGWSMVTDNGRRVGLVPTNYTRIVGQLEKKQSAVNSDDNALSQTVPNHRSMSHCDEDELVSQSSKEESQWRSLNSATNNKNNNNNNNNDNDNNNDDNVGNTVL